MTNAILSLGGESPEDVKVRLAGNRPRTTQTGGMVVAAHDRLAIATGWYVYAWSHVPAWQLKLRPRTYTVTVVRDPASRVLSLYRYLMDPDSDAGRPFGAPKAEREMAMHGFDHFLEVIPKPTLLNHLHMFSPRLDPGEAADAINACSLTFLIGEMGHGLEVLSGLIGRPLPERVERQSSAKFAPSDLQRERLHELLKPEYEMMGRLALRVPA